MQREVFGNVPTALKLSFYSIIPILLVYGAYMFAMRVKNWERGRPDNRRTTFKNAPRRMADFRVRRLYARRCCANRAPESCTQ